MNDKKPVLTSHQYGLNVNMGFCEQSAITLYSQATRYAE